MLVDDKLIELLLLDNEELLLVLLWESDALTAVLKLDNI